MSRLDHEYFLWLYDGIPRDPDSVAVRWHEDAVIQLPFEMRGTEGAFVGHDGVAAMFADLDEVARDMTYDVQRVVELDAPDRYLVLLNFSATSAGGGVPVNAKIAHVLTVREGRIARMDAYGTWDHALEAVGLSE